MRRALAGPGQSLIDDKETRLRKPPASFCTTFFIEPTSDGRIRTETLPTAGQAIADLLAERFTRADIAISLSDLGGRWQVAIHFGDEAECELVRDAVAAVAGVEAAAALQFGAVDAADWVRQSLAGLQPVTAGRFVVHGAHARARVPVNRVGIEIEAALAFGTGHHGTTRGCLMALDAICRATKRRRLVRSPARFPRALRRRRFTGRKAKISAHPRSRVLDVGTGSGVLAIAAARALRVPVLATDIDAFAASAARANVRHNRAGALAAVLRADGVGTQAIRARGPYELIFANILLAPLKRMATPLRALAAPAGRVVLSGILPAQANAVIAAYRPLALQSRIDVDGWTTLVLVGRRTRAPSKG
jgi:ribosomal protein L11 methyltransferase